LELELLADRRVFESALPKGIKRLRLVVEKNEELIDDHGGTNFGQRRTDNNISSKMC